MMTTEYDITCPFCGESFPIIIDCSISNQTYIEDCFVCCRPITFQVKCEDGEIIEVIPSRD